MELYFIDFHEKTEMHKYFFCPGKVHISASLHRPLVLYTIGQLLLCYKLKSGKPKNQFNSMVQTKSGEPGESEKSV